MTIQEYVERGREAVEAIKDYDQAQTDKLVYEAAKIIYQHAANWPGRPWTRQGWGTMRTRSARIRTRRRRFGHT
ncbi:MAG: hypothetical protein V8R75_01585 [Oscillospiraceae bacterium]